MEQFFELLKQQQGDETHFYVEVLLSVTEYKNFVDMIQRYKQDRLKMQ